MLNHHQPCLPGQMSAKRDMRTEAKQLDGVVKVVVIQLTTCTWSSIPFRFRAPLALQLWRVAGGLGEVWCYTATVPMELGRWR